VEAGPGTASEGGGYSDVCEQEVVALTRIWAFLICCIISMGRLGHRWACYGGRLLLAHLEYTRGSVHIENVDD